MIQSKLLLHVCCGPCSTSVIRRLQEKFKVIAYFFNPNIWPHEEYAKRLQAFLRIAKLESIDFLAQSSYDNNEWRRHVRGLEDEPEGGARCPVCYQMRLFEAAKMAKKSGCEYFATTLTISPHKKADVINKIGEELAKKYGLKFLSEDFKKKDGFKHSIELSKKFGLYRQRYCGCEFSIGNF